MLSTNKFRALSTSSRRPPLRCNGQVQEPYLAQPEQQGAQERCVACTVTEDRRTLPLHCTALHACSCTPGACGCTAVHRQQTPLLWASSARRVGAATTCSSHSPSPHHTHTLTHTSPGIKKAPKQRYSSTKGVRGEQPTEPIRARRAASELRLAPFAALAHATRSCASVAPLARRPEASPSAVWLPV